jgi:hypothetical protein
MFFLTLYFFSNLLQDEKAMETTSLSCVGAHLCQKCGSLTESGIDGPWATLHAM